MAARGPYAKGIAKRDEILDTAMSVFAEKGYDRTSFREIARLSGLSQAGLLHHYATKEELFSAVLRRRDEINREYARDDVDAITVDHLLSIIRHNAAEPGLVRLYVAMSSETADPASPERGFFVDRYRDLITELAADIREQQAAGRLSTTLDPETVASLLLAASDGLQIQWLLEPDEFDMGGRLSALWDALRAIP